MSGAGQATRLYLVRHAAPHECAAGRCCGRLDVPLSEAGRACAARLATSFAGLGVEAVYASPLGRAVATAEPIARANGGRDFQNAAPYCGSRAPWRPPYVFGRPRCQPDWGRVEDARTCSSLTSHRRRAASASRPAADGWMRRQSK